jgi:hypothetical protein
MCWIVYNIQGSFTESEFMPNSKQRITARRHKRRKESLKRKRAASLMNAKKSTLQKLEAINQLPKSVKEARL